MFITKKRTKRNPNTYIQLVESYRNEEGKVRQRVIKHIGSAATDEQLEKVISLGYKVKEKLLNGAKNNEIDSFIQQELSKINSNRTLILNCEPVKIINKGVPDIYGKIFDDIGLQNLIHSRSNYAEILKDIVLGKIFCLGSKKKISEQLSKKLDKHHNLNSIYRTMDKINEEVIDKLQNMICNYNKSLLQGDIKVLFYDATTIYFESFSDDDLRKLGYSKDLKFSQPQIVFTMLVTEEGLPLAYEVFPGNMYEGNTLKIALNRWQNMYPEQKITLVADSGMLNEINLSYLEQEGFNYIVCARLKNFSNKIKQDICETKQEYKGDYFHEMSVKNRRLIVSYKENRALKDRSDRDKNIDKIKKKLSSNAAAISLISNYGYKKFITINKESLVSLDEEKVNEAEKWDGLHGVITNITEMNPAEIYHHYRGLYQIEDAFRINKTDLKIRPIFHWTESRIKAHLAISYMSFCCYKAVEFKYNQKTSDKISHRSIREILCDVQIVIYQDRYNGEQFSMPLPIPPEAQIIYDSQEINLDLSPYRIVA